MSLILWEILINGATVPRWYPAHYSEYDVTEAAKAELDVSSLAVRIAQPQLVL